MQFNYNLQQRAALFGADARVALVVFSLIALVVGSAIHNAINNAQAVALLEEMRIAAKAIENYQLDTGQDPETNSSEPFRLEMRNLVEDINSTPNWQGPYLKGIKDTVSGTFGNKYLTNLSTGRLLGGLFVREADLPSRTGGYYCNDSSQATYGDCNIWVLIHFVPERIAKRIDKLVDNDDSWSSGDLRYHSTGSVNIFLKGPATINQD